MATYTMTVGSGKDYAQFNSAMSALQAGTGYNASDDVVIEVFGDVVMAISVVITTTKPASVTIQAGSGEEHDGTAESGASIYPTATNAVPVYVNTTVPFLIKDLIFKTVSNSGGAIFFNSGTHVVHRCLMYTGSSDLSYGITTYGTGLCTATNCMIFKRGTGAITTGVGIINYSTGFSRVYNCSVYGSAQGFYSFYGNLGYFVNCVALDCTNYDFYTLTSFDANSNYNASSDTTAPGAVNYRSLTASDEIVSTATPDLHLKAGSNLIGVGTDLGTTYGAEIDIDQYDRDAGGVTWDIGADQYGYPAAGSGSTIIRGLSQIDKAYFNDILQG